MTSGLSKKLENRLEAARGPEDVMSLVARDGSDGEYYAALERSAAGARDAARHGDEEALLRWAWHTELRVAESPREELNRRKRWWRMQQALPNLRPGDRLLDAGCGMGTDCLLFAALRGVVATGVDVQDHRLALAEMRRRHWSRIFGGGGGAVESFRRMNVLGMDFEDGSFDVVWSNQAIEHIHPPEGFLKEAHRVLRPGGWMMIANLNGLNPLAVLKARRERGEKSRVERRRDPSTGAEFEYANEWIRNPRRLAAAACEAGFRDCAVEYFGCIPSPLAATSGLGGAIYTCEEFLSRTPAAMVLANDYVLTARRA